MVTLFEYSSACTVQYIVQPLLHGYSTVLIRCRRWYTTLCQTLSVSKNLCVARTMPVNAFDKCLGPPYPLAIDDTPTRASQVPRSLQPTCSIRGQGRRDHDQFSHLENLQRCRDTLTSKQLGWSTTASIVRSKRCSTRVKAWGEDERTWRLVHSLQFEEGRSVRQHNSPRLWKVLVSFGSGLRSQREGAAHHRPRRGTPSKTEKSGKQSKTG